MTNNELNLKKDKIATNFNCIHYRNVGFNEDYYEIWAYFEDNDDVKLAEWENRDDYGCYTKEQMENVEEIIDDLVLNNIELLKERFNGLNCKDLRSLRPHIKKTGLSFKRLEDYPNGYVVWADKSDVNAMDWSFEEGLTYFFIGIKDGKIFINDYIDYSDY